VKYQAEAYWSGVAEQIRQRSIGGDIAGDDAPYFRYKRRKFLKRFLEQLDVKGKTVMELGCGPGGNLLILSKKGPAQLIGVDVSSAMLELAGRTTAGAACPVDLRKTDGTSLPLPDLAVNLAVTVTVLQHNPDAQVLDRMIEELCRVTQETLVLIEDIGDEIGPFEEGRTYVGRPVSEYADRARRFGFRLLSAENLGLNASRTVHDYLWKRLVGPSHPEGKPIPRLTRTVFRLAVAVTRHLDDHISDHSDLTRMTFVRQAP
jgi:SAM-dependent methyltransferase